MSDTTKRRMKPKEDREIISFFEFSGAFCLLDFCFVQCLKSVSELLGKGFQMQFNYAKERKKFDEDWKKMKVEYKVAGMSEEDIQIMYEFDLRAFRQKRTYCLHNESREEMEEKQNPIYMESIRFEETEQTQIRRKGWLDEIDNKKLYRAIKKLNKEDIEILTLWAIKGYSATEIAKLKKVSQQAISKKVMRIKKFLKTSCEESID